MIIETADGASFDTDRDLEAPERHVLQKLFLWKSMAASLEEFRAKTEEALRKGWNNSGPLAASAPLKAIIEDLEKALSERLRSEDRSPET